MTNLPIISNDKGVSWCSNKCLADLIAIFLQSRLILITVKKKKKVSLGGHMMKYGDDTANNHILQNINRAVTAD